MCLYYLFISIYFIITWTCSVSCDGNVSKDSDNMPYKLHYRNAKVKCFSPFDCLKGNVINALDKIKKAQKYYLLEDLRFEKTQNMSDNDVPVISPDSNLRALFRKSSDLFRTHALVWNCLPGIDMWLFQDTPGKIGLIIKNSAIKNGRTFGLAKRRLAMALLPIMFKLGVIVTLLILLTVFTLKSLAVGLLLLFFASAGVVAKLKHLHPYPLVPPPSPPHKDIHIYLHSNQAHHGWLKTSQERETSPPPPWSYLPRDVEAYYTPQSFVHNYIK